MDTQISVRKPSIEVWTEGKTDWKILKKALEKLCSCLEINFHEYEKDMGDDVLLKKCKTFAERPNDVPIVFIFDRDNKNILSEISDPDNNSFKQWSNNVFSFAIPIPNHRIGCENVSIEMYFTDSEIQTSDSNGRRLFLTSEFNERSGKLILNTQISIGNKGQLHGYTEPHKGKVIDSDVFDETHNNIALNKSSFANNIYNNVSPFNSFNFYEFRRIFDIVNNIILIAQPRRSIYFPDLEEYFKGIQCFATSQQLCQVYQMIYDILAMGLQIFIITTIRCYENVIVNEAEHYRKKVNPIKRTISEDFLNPSFRMLFKLAEYCYYLIDTKAPQGLIKMKSSLENIIVLRDIGKFLDDLEKLFLPSANAAILVNKAEIRRSILKFVLPEFIKYSDISLSSLEQKINANGNMINSEILQQWRNVLKIIIEELNPLFSNTIVLKSLEYLDAKTGNYVINIKQYQNSTAEISKMSIPIEEIDNYQSYTTELMLDDQLTVQLYPFLLVKDDIIYFYKKTRARGYEYRSVINSRVYIKETKSKFNHSIFKTGSKQELFWTDVIPISNELNGIRANIPSEGLDDFVGRRMQIDKIREEVIEIPNQNGLIYGPGGIGKTALMLQLSSELFNETNAENVHFNNIIWVSAKSDYYDYIFNSIEKREAQVESLDGIIFAILQFFNLENLEEYNSNDRKELMFELIWENKILLILDNFETISTSEADRIVKLFEIEVKRKLRNKPEYFKMIVTSRKQIRGGFHQIELEGLDLRESRQLLENLYLRYNPSAQKLTDEQEKMLHEVTKGIPIVIKHCFAKLYEHNLSFDSVLSSLSAYSGEIIKFSFKEILQLIEKKDKEQVQLRVLILLEITNYPLLIRQMADILEIEESIIENKIPTLIDYQCLKRIFIREQEKYTINEEIRILTRSIAQKYGELADGIRNRITNNFSLDKQMDYTLEEKQIIGIFEKYLLDKDNLQAEDFINAQLKDKPTSILLKFHYARYLKEYKRENEKAINILEEIREPSRNNPSVLTLLFSYYISQNIPNYDKASVYVNELERNLKREDDNLRLKIAEFYVGWSTSIKIGTGKEIDLLNEKVRQNHYKELARKAILILNKIQARTHEYFYLCSQSNFNVWNYDTALTNITTAINKCSEPHDLSRYKILRKVILEKQEYYSQRKL